MNKRWYDVDPTVSLAVSLMRNANIMTQYKCADIIVKKSKDNGIDGVVASVWEARKIKEVCGQNFKVLCPGIRPVWASKDDQKRLATPSKAIEEGADYLVIGRAVTNAPNRLEAMSKIYEEIEQAMKG